MVYVDIAGKEVKEESDLIPFVMYLTGYKEEQAVRVYENWKRNVKNQYQYTLTLIKIR